MPRSIHPTISSFERSPARTSDRIHRPRERSAIARPDGFRGDHARSIPTAYTAGAIPRGMKASRPRARRLRRGLHPPPRLLVPNAAPRAALPVRLVVLLHRNRRVQHVRDRNVAEVLARPEQPLLRVPERREERLPRTAQEA